MIKEDFENMHNYLSLTLTYGYKLLFSLLIGMLEGFLIAAKWCRSQAEPKQVTVNSYVTQNECEDYLNDRLNNFMIPNPETGDSKIIRGTDLQDALIRDERIDDCIFESFKDQREILRTLDGMHELRQELILSDV